jgi:hypothetical protein
MPTTGTKLRDGWTRRELRSRKHTRKIQGRWYTVIAQPGGVDRNWALWQDHERIGQFGSVEDAKDWVARYIVGGH